MSAATCHILAKGGCTRWKIVIGSSASLVEKHAAEELQYFLQEISGAFFHITNDEGDISPYEILIGDNRHLSFLGINIAEQNLGTDGFTIRTIGDCLIIAGGKSRGTLYGIYTFLEDYLGCRWFSPKVSRIPKQDCIEIPHIMDEHIPVLDYREPIYFDAFDGDWAARNKVNGHFQKLEDKHGGRVKYSQFVHTFRLLVPVEEYFDTHPEYFSEINGKRISDHTQLCLTNKEVLEIAINNVKQWLREDPEAKIVSISQNDWYNPCQCEKCREVDEIEGSHSGTLLHFVNQIAEAIEKDYPHVYIDTLAYQYTRKAPKYIRPRKNVIVRLCTIECCFSHPLENCNEISFPFSQMVEPGSTFAKDLREWSQICDRLYIWDYVTNYAHYLMPFPNLKVLQPNIKFLSEHNVKGICEEGNYQSAGGEFAELKSYVLAKLLWNPHCNLDEVIDEFLEGFYGQAAKPIREYIDMLHNKVADEDIHTGIYDSPTKGYLTSDIIKKASELFDCAENLADDSEILQRVRTARLPITYVQLYTTSKDNQEREKLLVSFLKGVKDAGITRISEFLTLDECYKLLKQGVSQEDIEKQFTEHFKMG